VEGDDDFPPVFKDLYDPAFRAVGEGRFSNLGRKKRHRCGGLPAKPSAYGKGRGAPNFPKQIGIVRLHGNFPVLHAASISAAAMRVALADRKRQDSGFSWGAV